MEQPLSPTAMAKEFRAKAATLTGADRDYCLWLAGEWDKTAMRCATGRGPKSQTADAEVGRQLMN
jgi:hypothetical protein